MEQQPGQPVEVVLFGAPVPPADFLTLVMDGNGMTIRRNGAVMAGFLYRINEMDKAIAEFRALVRKVSDGHGDGHATLGNLGRS